MYDKMKVLQRLIDYELIDINDFYAIGVSQYDLKLQGNYTPELAIVVEDLLGGKLETDSIGFLVCTGVIDESEVRIVLT